MRQPRPHKGALETVSGIGTPLKFVALVVGVFEVTVTAVAVRQPDPFPLLLSVIVSLIFLTCVVLGIAIWRPGTLEGVQRLSQDYSQRFAENLWMGLDGSLENLPAGEQAEAWLFICAVIREGEVEKIDSGYRAFCEGVAKRLEQRASKKARPRRTARNENLYIIDDPGLSG